MIDCKIVTRTGDFKTENIDLNQFKGKLIILNFWEKV